MNRVDTSIACILLWFAIGVGALADEAPDELVGMGAYVASDDLAKSVEFYSALLDLQPIIELDGFVAFDIAGGWFAIVSRNQYAPGSEAGSGAVPYIRVSHLEMLRTRAAAALGTAAPEVIVEPGISLLKIKDPNGQLVEFFMLTPQ